MTSTSTPLQLLLVDDHALFREGLTRLLEREPGFVVAGTASTAREALHVLSMRHVDIVLLDYDLGAERAVHFISEARACGFSGSILIVTAGVSDLESIQLVESGVAGVFHKHNRPELLCECVRKVAAGEVWLENKYLKPLFRRVESAEPAVSPRLTERERHVLRCVFQGLANKEIAEGLGVSETSVKGTLQQLFQKTGVRTRTQLVRIALEQYRDQL
jgi:two-component system nitrate/nitrite response regulator NarL